MRTVAVGFLLATLAALPATAGPPADPLKSPMWTTLASRYFGGSPVVFDERVKVVVPMIVENQAQVPVTADARALPDITQMIVFADLNPVQLVLRLTPMAAAPFVSFRMKVEQATPVRAAALTRDGVWHVGGVFLQASGGGCSAPALARLDTDWSATVGQTQGRLWPDAGGYVRARLRVRHPMDTGMAKDNTPAYFIERMEVRSISKAPLAVLEMFEPVSEDPTLTLLPRLPPGDASLEFESRDNNGNVYRSSLSAPWRQSLAPRLYLLSTETEPC